MKFFTHWNLFFFRDTSIAAITAHHPRHAALPEHGRNLPFRTSRRDAVCVGVHPICMIFAPEISMKRLFGSPGWSMGADPTPLRRNTHCQGKSTGKRKTVVCSNSLPL